MRVEQSVDPGQTTFLPLSRHGLLDPEMSGGARMRVHHRLVVTELLECRDQAGRITGQLHPRHVGERLAPTADGELHQLRNQWCEEEQREAEERQDRLGAAAVVVVASSPTTPPEHPNGDVGHQRDEADEGHRQCRDEDVVVLDVAELVGDHPFELDAIHLLEESSGHRDRRMLRISPSGEGDRSDVVDDVDAGLRQAGGDAQPFHDVVEPRVLHRIRRSCPAHRERDRVGLPIGDRRQRHRHDERDDDTDDAEAKQCVEHERDEDREPHEPSYEQR